MKFLIRIATNMIGLWFITLITRGIVIIEPTSEHLAQLDPIFRTIIAFLTAAVILAIANSFVRPIIKFLAFPLYVITFGLFFIVVNGLMLYLTSWISGQVGMGIHVTNFAWALMGGIFISIINLALDHLTRNKR